MTWLHDEKLIIRSQECLNYTCNFLVYWHQSLINKRQKNRIMKDLGKQNCIFYMCILLASIKFGIGIVQKWLSSKCMFHKTSSLARINKFSLPSMGQTLHPIEITRPSLSIIIYAHANYAQTSSIFWPNTYFHFLIVGFGSLGSCSKYMKFAKIVYLLFNEVQH
jgi:hypothetical protein